MSNDLENTYLSILKIGCISERRKEYLQEISTCNFLFEINVNNFAMYDSV